MPDLQRSTAVIDGNPVYAADLHGLIDNSIILPKAVTNTKMADMLANTIKGALANGSPVDLTAAQVRQVIGASVKYTLVQTAHGFSVGNVLRFDAGTSLFVLAQADAYTDERALGIVETVTDANTVVMVFEGFISLTGLTPGAAYYLSATTAGAYTTTAPFSGFRLTGNLTASSAIVTGISSTANLAKGMGVTGQGVPASTTILSVDSGTQITMTANVTTSGTGASLLFANAKDVLLFTAFSSTQAVVNVGTDPTLALSRLNQLSEVTPTIARQNLNIDQRMVVSDAAYSILATDRYVGLTAITAARVFTLPAASSLNPGQALVIADESGLLTSTLSLSLLASGSDTINGVAGLVLTTPNQLLTFYSNGSNRWTTVVPPNPVSQARAWVNFNGNPQTSTAYTRSGTTVTATKTAHGYAAGTIIEISAATDSGLNGVGILITIVDANTFSFTTTATGANGTFTIRSRIRSQFNVQSISSNGTGLYTVSFATALGSTNYVVALTTSNYNSSETIGVATSAAGAAPNLKSTTQVQIESSNGSAVDLAEINVLIFSN